MDDLPDAAEHPGTAMHSAIGLQDQLMCAATELDRLQRLLLDAVQAMLQTFLATDTELRSLQAAPPAASARADIERAVGQLRSAVKGLQFQDMASQLIDFTQQRIAHCADRIAADALRGDGEPQAVVQSAPTRVSPVVQDELDTGHVELF